MLTRLLRPINLFLLCLAVVAGAGCASSSQAKFQSPQEAADSMVTALRAKDTTRLREIFGPDGDGVMSSGDAVADRAEIARFIAAYDQKHLLQPDATDGATLLVGEKDWPFPVPIVRSNGGFVFDTAAGTEEILNRRIGRNELDAQQVCLAIVDAQREYVVRRPMGGDLPLYARKIISDAGSKNGLYWQPGSGEPPSPLGELVAQASAEGYGATKSTDTAPPPYRGYRYRLLTSQGPHARGGSLNYEVNGQLIGGFGVVAYPAQYGNSGIMTFITNHDGVVYERDLGPATEEISRTMMQFDPGPHWRPIGETSLSGAQ